MKANKLTFFIILAVTLLIAAAAVFGVKSSVLGIHIRGAQDMRWGIDIRGGVDAVFEPKNLDRAPTADELEAARTIVETRLDQQNILDREVTTDLADGKVLVRFPWRAGETDFDPSTAIKELGEMAELSFRDPDGNVVLTGKNVRPNTHAQRGSDGMYYEVAFELDSEGGAAFAEATGRLVGQIIYIYMDETVISDPTVNSRIDGGTGVITGKFSQKDAQALADRINAGSLPFSMESTTYSAISPSLGSNALEIMLWAGLIAFGLICLFMLCYYRLSGLVAVVALILQVTGTLLILSVTQITLTLQGVAGIILIVGMGVDANIIIAERIREELRAGKAIDSAVASGFKRAFSAVLDANITTLLVAFVMMIFGSGAILSFAYTLAIGIAMNFVAGVFANRLMTQSITRLPVFRKNGCFLGEAFMKKETKIYNFYNMRRFTLVISGLVIALGLVMTFVRGGVTLDIQFTGGAMFRYSIEQPDDLNPEEAASVVARALNGRPVRGQLTEDLSEGGSHRLVLSMTAGEDLSNEDIAAFEEALREAYPDQGFRLTDSNNVSPFYGQRFLRNGLIALLLSFGLILLYIWFSFRRIHGLSAALMGLVALIHDVALVFFAFVIFGIPIGDTFIAVALTILAYSINDTVVLYDRIRENALFDPSSQTDALVNRSASQTLSRTINTSVTTVTTMVILYVFSLLFGLTSIQAFALPMMFGMISGCYSTIFIVGPLWVSWQKTKNQNALAKKKS